MQSKGTHTRDHILTIGRDLMSERGFNALGLGELLKTAKVPKGSFYHYFESKEDFGCALLERYVEGYHQRLNELWVDADVSGRDHLMSFFNMWMMRQSTRQCSQQCLIVKLGAEISDMSAGMRRILAEGTSSIVERMADQIKIGITDGSIPSHVEPRSLANHLYQMWLGASLLAKLDQSIQPFQSALKNTESLLPRQ